MLSTVLISRQQYRFNCSSLSFRQKGAALMMLLTVLVLGSLAILVTSLNVSSGRTEQEMKTAKALAQAKEALIAHAVSVILPTVPSVMTTARPGDLPCPALDNSGIAAVSCGDAIGSLPSRSDWADCHG